MKAPDKRDLIEGMAELLKAHEEPYEAGSWESFLEQQEGKKRNPYLWIGYAAALLIMMSLAAIIFNQSPELPMEIAKTSQPAIKKSTDQQKVEDERFTQLKPIQHQTTEIRTLKGLQLAQPSTATGVLETEVSTVAVTQVEEGLIASFQEDKQTPSTPKHAAIVEPPSSPDLMKFLQSESTKVALNSNAQPSKWDFGIEVAPTILDSKLSMGAGITTAYRLSDRFSLSTGVSYVSLDAEASVNNQPVGLMSNKKLTAIDANIRAIDIPLAITYHLSEKLYTSVGVSYFNVLSEQRSNNYLTEMEISRTMADPATGKIETLQTTLKEQNIEPSASQPLDGNSYLGFFNFSVGHVQPLYKNHKIVIEPFLKIPLGKLSNDDLKLSNGGIKLRYSF